MLERKRGMGGEYLLEFASLRVTADLGEVLLDGGTSGQIHTAVLENL